jgi:undecaprenyl-phosphate galactose phosphotransferase
MNDTNPIALPAQTFDFTQPFECVVNHNFLKRTFDILFSSLVLIIASPMLLLIAVAIRFFSKGKVVYAHERIGRGGKSFRCLKFRTMYADADQRLIDILANNPEMRKEWEQNHKLKNDPRVTPIGKFLRKTSLDEFPQFFNVLRGDLSVVGPRPVVRSEIQKHIGAKASTILSVRPGITGLWQVSGRSDTSYTTRIQLDEKYIQEQSFLLDLKLICKTVPCMLWSKGAY